MEPVLAVLAIAWLVGLGRKKRRAAVRERDVWETPEGDIVERFEGDTPRQAGAMSVGLPADSYQLPVDFDMLRGLFITPDCFAVAEAPGFWNGIEFLPPDFTSAAPIEPPGRYPSGLPMTSDGGDASGMGPTLDETFASSPTTGAVGFVEFWLERNATPQDIVMRMIAEVSPMCAGVDPSQWGPGLTRWYNDTVDRVVAERAAFLGEEFSP